jgi:hypothetical protein
MLLGDRFIISKDVEPHNFACVVMDQIVKPSAINPSKNGGGSECILYNHPKLPIVGVTISFTKFHVTEDLTLDGIKSLNSHICGNPRLYDHKPGLSLQEVLLNLKDNVRLAPLLDPKLPG